MKIVLNDDEETFVGIDMQQLGQALFENLDETAIDVYKNQVKSWFLDGAINPLYVWNGPNYQDKWELIR